MTEGLFNTRDEYLEALRQALSLAAEQGSRELFWLDPDFDDWPLSEHGVLQTLSAWARPQRRLHLLAASFENLQRRHPRFVQWRQTYGHLITAGAYEAEAISAAPLAALLLAPGTVLVRKFDAGQWRCAISGSRPETRGDELRAVELFDAIAQRSSESFAASTLGL